MTHDFLRGAAPIITILNQEGVEQYRYEHPDAVSSSTTTPPTQEIKVTSWRIRAGVNSDSGSAAITIQDHANDLTDTTKPFRPLKIKNGWRLVIQLQKPHLTTDPVTWFYGIIERPSLQSPAHGLQYVTVTAIGWGVRLAQRFAHIEHHQKRAANGLSYDSTDTSAKVSEIVKRLLSESDSLIQPGVPLDITTTGVDDIAILLPEFVRRFQSAGTIINELAQSAGCIYGVTPDRDLYFHIRRSREGGHLITNDTADPDDTIIDRWDNTKLAIIKNRPYGWQESSIGVGYSTLIGVGALHESLDVENKGSTMGFSLATNRTAIPFRPPQSNIIVLSIGLRKTNTNTVTGPLRCTLVGGAAGSIDETDIRASETIPAARLERELSNTETRYVEIRFSRKPTYVRPDEFLNLVLDRMPSGNVEIRAKQGTQYTGRLFRSLTADSNTWGNVAGEADFRAYSAQTMHIVAQDTTRRAEQGHKETTYPLHDYPTSASVMQAFQGLLDLVGSVRRKYDPITTTIPDTRPALGSLIRIYDRPRGLDTDVELVGYEIGATQTGGQNLIANEMMMHVEEWFA